MSDTVSQVEAPEPDRVALRRLVRALAFALAVALLLGAAAFWPGRRARSQRPPLPAPVVFDELVGPAPVAPGTGQ